MTAAELVLAVAALMAGGFMKGAVGVGAPVVAIPVLSILFNVPFAVAVMSLPNLMSNVWQGWENRQHLLHRRFVLAFTLSGAAGAILGTFVLAFLPDRPLTIIVALVLILYLGFRVARPGWHIGQATADRWAIAAGALGGLLQGASGLSAPASVTFLNALRLERRAFIGTISAFFMAISAVQVPTLWATGLLDGPAFGFSLLAMVPLFGGMPLGAWAARHVSRETFDRLIMALLAVVALRLLWVGLAGA
ncbi:MAG: TSUP family transporter [Limimaricola sp.]|uniref:sulfite exporter TauE/SafE family protein n=1 Tax=Limimaricola sp. TaxID=2211665 RepID=UPI001D2AE006|nr:sulfite exporter TauE/SafE family protein [Limimaricola sp.]MBI1415707.1 TSUP family transporter [Limimaricola sp.]